MALTNLFGNELASNKRIRTLVFEATHDGVDNRLPLMKRSFISFTFGGKNIEDFGLIAIIENNSMEKKIYSEFVDHTTDSDILDGQLYWGSHYSANSLDLALFTDEITERELTSFALWFKPGFSRELILAEHPNRGIMARISSPPEYHMLPFEKKIKSALFGAETSTTIYKGKINISFVMDDPFWYSLTNMLDELNAGYWKNISTKQLELIANSKDALKIIEEDGIPVSTSLRGNLLIGTNAIVTVLSLPARTRRNSSDTAPETYIGAYIGGRATTGISEEGFNFPQNEEKYFYYAGTAPGTPYLEFTVPISYGTGQISSIQNSYTNPSKPYNTITIESINKQEFKITTPSILTAFNLALLINVNYDDEEERKAMYRDCINHYLVRNLAVNSNTLLSVVLAMPTAITFKINCKTGETLIEYTFNGSKYVEDAGDAIRSKYLKIEDRNYPDESGYIHSWTLEHPEYSYKIYHDFSLGLLNVLLKYKYMYL